MTDKELHNAIYKISAAKSLFGKTLVAEYQTEIKNHNTIINVSHDEAVVLRWALDRYIKRNEIEDCNDDG